MHGGASCATQAGNKTLSQRCVKVHQVCVQGESIVLYGPNADAEVGLTNNFLERLGARDQLMSMRLLHPTWRQNVVASSSDSIHYIPYAWPTTSSSARHLLPELPLFAREMPATEPIFSPHHALLFTTAYPSSFPEVFFRSVMNVFEYSCLHPDRDLRLRPTFWSIEYANLLKPFSRHAVQPLALFPYSDPKPEYEGAVFNIRADVARTDRQVIQAYANASYQFFRDRKGAQCHSEAHVCDFSIPPSGEEVFKRLRPWATMQAILAYARGHALVTAPPDPTRVRLRACDVSGASAGDESCKLRIAFVDRRRYRRLVNLAELVSACNAWQPLSVICETVDLSAGLQGSVHLLQAIDVLISPHGGDLLNALALHSGASVVEILPVTMKGCPCDFFSKLFATGAQHADSNDAGMVFHYRLPATNSTPNKLGCQLAGFSCGGAAGAKKSYNDDLTLSWPALVPVLDAIQIVASNAALYPIAARQWLMPYK